MAQRLGLDVERFRAELIDGTYTARVERDADGARAAGIAATPAFIVNGAPPHRGLRRGLAGRCVESHSRQIPRGADYPSPADAARHNHSHRCPSPSSSPPAAGATRTRRRRRTPSRTSRARTACARTSRRRREPDRGRVPAGRRARRCRSWPTRWPRARSSRWPARSSPRPATSRMAFGMIDADGTPVYGPTAVYVAPTPGAPAEGPFVAPADVLLTDEALPLQAGGDDRGPVRRRLRRRRRVRQEGPVRGAGGDQAGRRHAHRRDRRRSTSRPRSADPIPARRRRRRRRCTRTRSRRPRATSRRSTRAIPPSDMHDVDFADVVGKKPVALLFSTPQLCQSRVCGPVTDMELQMKSKYGDQMTFIHQEVYVDNDINKGLREPLQAVQPAVRAVAVRRRREGRDHGPARGLDRRAAVRERGQVRAVRARARGTRGGAGRRCARAGGRARRTASSSASSCRSRSGCSRGRPRRCS